MCQDEKLKLRINEYSSLMRIVLDEHLANERQSNFFLSLSFAQAQTLTK